MSVVGRLLGFGGSKAPSMAPVGMAMPAMTPQIDAGSQAARDRQRQLAGMQGTVLTGGLGDEDRPNRTKKTLLGQ